MAAVPDTRLVASPPFKPKANIIRISHRKARGVRTARASAAFLGADDGVLRLQEDRGAFLRSSAALTAVSSMLLRFRRKALTTVTTPITQNTGAPFVRMSEEERPAAVADTPGAPWITQS